MNLVAFLLLNSFALSEERKSGLNFYTGVFDWADEIEDDVTDIIGLEHRDDSLYRNTFLGKFLPVTGAFITGKNSVYVYTGIEAQYNLGIMYDSVIDNDKEAMKWYRRAAEQGHEEAQYKLGMMYLNTEGRLKIR